MIIGDRVEIVSLNLKGKVISVEFDIYSCPIYTIELDDNAETPDGMFIARREELKWVGY